MTHLPGISGSLLPLRFLADARLDSEPWAALPNDLRRERRRLVAWWHGVAESCGPATGLRGLFDLVATPLFARLGYRVGQAVFDTDHAHARLDTETGAAVGLLIRGWAARPSVVWRDATTVSRRHGSRWCIVLSPPFVSVVSAGGHASRRAIDFRLPHALDERSIRPFWLLTSAAAFDHRQSPPIDTLVANGMRYHDRVRVDLQDGVVRGLEQLQTAIASSRSAAADVEPAFDEALTIVYRIMFLLFAESRELVPRDHPVYKRAYAVETLCRDAVAARTAGLWDALAAVTRLSRVGCRTDDLIVRPFNGRLFARAAAPVLERRDTGTRRARWQSSKATALQQTLVALGTRPGRGGREFISYADLGVEQLGAVYERVLDLEPGRRKQTGTFYTPQPLAEFVVRRTLAPLVADRTSDDILRLRIVDPAMGSGAFLVAACRYLADAYEVAVVDEGRYALSDIDDDWRASARRVVAERCLTGVDVNPVAVQLARLSLWLASLARGKPLGFLDHQLRVGNSLIGASPDDLDRTPGRRRSHDRGLPLFDTADLENTMRSIAAPLHALRHQADDTVADVRRKEALWHRLARRRSPLTAWRTAASLWCARWFWPQAPHAPGRPSPAELRAALDTILRGDRMLPDAQLTTWLTVAGQVALRYQFFHWPLEFADVFYNDTGRPRDQPGFDAVIGNPPWEMVRRDSGPGVTGQPDPRTLLRFIRDSGLYPSCDRGQLNLYQPFVDRALSLTRPGGRLGLILPWGLAADDGARSLRARLLDRARIDTLIGLDNSHRLFPIHRGLRIAALIAATATTTGEVKARFGVKTPDDLDTLPETDDGSSPSAYPIRLGRSVLETVGGPARRIPAVRSMHDLRLLEQLCRAHPAFGSEQGWAARFGRDLNATEDKNHFGATGLPVIEGKHVSPFVAEVGRARRFITRRRAERRLPDRRFDRPRLAYRDVSGVGNRVSLIAAVVPPGVVTMHTLFCLRAPMPVEQQHFLCGIFNSYVMNSVVRMLMGSHVTTSLIEGLPIPTWSASARQRRISGLARRLAVAQDSETAATLQAAVARLYRLASEDFRALLDGFPLVERSERDRAAACLERTPGSVVTGR